MQLIKKSKQFFTVTKLFYTPKKNFNIFEFFILHGLIHRIKSTKNFYFMDWPGWINKKFKAKFKVTKFFILLNFFYISELFIQHRLFHKIKNSEMFYFLCFLGVFNKKNSYFCLKIKKAFIPIEEWASLYYFLNPRIIFSILNWPFPYLQENLYIVRYHIGAFYFFLLPKDFYIVHEHIGAFCFFLFKKILIPFASHFIWVFLIMSM